MFFLYTAPSLLNPQLGGGRMHTIEPQLLLDDEKVGGSRLWSKEMLLFSLPL